MNHRIIPSLLACVLLCGTATAFARRPPPPPPPRSTPHVAPEHPSSLEQAVKQVQHKTRGHILAADKISRGRSDVYRIKVLTPQGQVRVVQLHSSTRPRPKSGQSGSDQGGY